MGVAESEDEKGTGYLKLRFKSSCFSAMPNSVLFDRAAGVRGMGFGIPNRIRRRATKLDWFLKAVLVVLCWGTVFWAVEAWALTHPAVVNPVDAEMASNSVQIAQAGSIDELRRQQQQIEQQRSQVSKERDRLKNMQTAAEGDLKGLQKHIKVTAEQIKQSENRLQKATKQLRELEVTLVKAEQAYQQKQFATVARLRFLQRQQIERGWAVLLQSQNLNEFLDRRRQLKLVYETDREMLKGLKKEADRIEQQRNQVEQKKNEISLLTQQLLAQKSDFEAQADFQKGLIERLKTDHKALEAAEAQLARDSQNISQLIRQRIPGGIAYRGTGKMLLPCAGEITSGFGWRTHPILGYERFHAGLDIGADYGTTIYAADSGTVIFAGWYGGYGNAVIIDHGGGITSLYAHSSELYVSEGQTVRRGAAIAAVGSSGLSTGPHLHFEIRENGEPVDPLAYL